MYQSTFSIVSSEISPTAWFRRCIVTYASITRPEMSRSRRIIEEPAEEFRQRKTAVIGARPFVSVSVDKLVTPN